LQPGSSSVCAEPTTTSEQSRTVGLTPRHAALARFEQPARRRRFRASVLIGLLVVGFAAGGFAWTISNRGGPRGQKIAGFALKDVRTGQVLRLADHRGRVLAIVFTSTTCPICQIYFSRLNALAKGFEGRGVDFVAINSSASESDDVVVAHARASKIRFPVLKDPKNRVADSMRAERTCEVFLIDRSGVLQYRGAVDDQYTRESHRDQPEHNYLASAIEAVLAGTPVSLQTTPAVGSPIERAPRPE
jgi:peroxiredoxin